MSSNSNKKKCGLIALLRVFDKDFFVENPNEREIILIRNR